MAGAVSRPVAGVVAGAGAPYPTAVNPASGRRLRLVIGAFGSEGDTRPYLALAAGLRAAGHEVVACSDRGGEDLAARLEVPWRELPGDFRAHFAPHGGLRAALDRTDGGLSGLRFFHRMASAHTGAWIDTLAQAARDFRADLILGSGLAMYAAVAAAELARVRVGVAGAFPMTPTREFPSPVAVSQRSIPLLNPASHHVAARLTWWAFRSPTVRARRARGLGAPRVRWLDLPIVYGFSPALVPRPNDWPETVAVTGAWHIPDEPAWEPPTALRDFLAGGEPPAYVGFGSMASADLAPLLRTLIAGLDGRRAVVATGWSGLDAGALGELPETVRLIEPIPHGWLLPRCAFAVHHCGAGTTHAVARAGIASVPMPFAADQPFWAARLRARGIASIPLDRRSLTPADVRAAVAQARTPAMRDAARAVAAEMATEDSVGAVARHLLAGLVS